MIRRALGAELLKLRFSTILWISAAVAVVFPILIGLVMVGVLGADSAIVVEASVEGFLMQFELVVAIGGLIGFGFLFSWIFGREFADGTVTDLLALPVGRLEIVGAKFVLTTIWCLILALVHYGVGLAFTTIALQGREGGVTAGVIGMSALHTLVTTGMVIGLSTPVALLASIGRGYLAPLGFVILMIVIAQLLGAVGAAAYFPWAVPGLYAGVLGPEGMQLAPFSLLLPFVVGVVGVMTTLWWWSRSP